MMQPAPQADDPLQTWREKRAAFESELAIASDVARKFELRKLIEECRREIARLEAVSCARPALPVEPARVDTHPWNVPYSKNPFFTGREQVLKDIALTLKKTGAAALSGLPGVGKTQAAAQFAHLHRDEYQAVLWASAESRETLVSDFVAIARMLNLPGKEEPNQAVAVVKEWIKENAGCLLILDSAHELTVAMEFIPPIGKGHLLLTTQKRATDPVAELVEIKPMDREEGPLFLIRRAGIIKEKAPFSAAIETDRKLAEQICQELGGLPLALDQAGAFIRETPSTLAEYIGLYQSEGKKLRAERGEIGEHPSVTVTFSLAFKKVCANSAAAAELIRVCAFLEPDAIPEEIFTKGAGKLGQILAASAAHGLAFAQCLKEAGRFSLIDRNAQNKTLDIHRLLQAVIIDGMETAEQHQWAVRTAQAVAMALASRQCGHRHTCGGIIPHALACLKAVATRHWDITEAAPLLDHITVYGDWLRTQQCYEEADHVLKGVLEVQKASLGERSESDPSLLPGLLALARLHRDRSSKNDLEQADRLYRQVLKISGELLLGPGNRRPKAEAENLEKIRDERKQILKRDGWTWTEDGESGGSDERSFRERVKIARQLREEKKNDHALHFFEQALIIAEDIWGQYHPGVDTVRNELAELYQLQGKYAEARALYSCFISYSSKDDDFAQRLYADLQAKNVRCWKFDENAKWGEPVWGEIDTAIRRYDRLVVICSQHSLQSPPVIREIERALEKEDREHKNVLFPIRIDDYVFDEWEHPRKADVVSKVIGDFRGVNDLAAYSKAFPRFLDALNRPQQASKTG